MSSNFKKRIFTSISLLFLVILIFKFNLALIYCLILIGVLSILEFIQITKKIFKNNLGLILINKIFILYIFLFCYLFLILSNQYNWKLIIYILLLGCVASDIGGFIFGKTFKGPKLTKTSPNKTYAGAMGSIFLTMLIMIILFNLIMTQFTFKILVIGLIVSIACQLGDLFFSLLKRKAKIKDTGNFLPGHGGILDRIDGILVGLPVGFITMAVIF
tara:strand:- start:3911 stop:4558 length:648 start_codon:yes stop_codon:yes gene_type:complete